MTAQYISAGQRDFSFLNVIVGSAAAGTLPSNRIRALWERLYCLLPDPHMMRVCGPPQPLRPLCAQPGHGEILAGADPGR